ncbi:MAG: holo-[acyl-carrier-protein] synthase [Desulfovermiculus sp.]|nr:holo-[acyl-carrier-protein] synthase [Desulfovermiculus sp.]
MIVGLGVDVVELDRIEKIWQRHRNRFASRILTPAEHQALPAAPVAYLASRFAAKEAAVKALGTGFRDGITLHSIAVQKLYQGQPQLVFYGQAAQRAQQLSAEIWHLSLSHSRYTACAVVILETG